jgi:PRTRC genetic system protein E
VTLQKKANRKMIQQILKIAQSCVSLQILAVAAADGTLSLTFVPKVKTGTDPKMATVFTLKGTPVELEGELATHLDAIQAKRETLAETVDAVKAVIDQATKDAAAKATEKKLVKAKPSVPTAAAGITKSTPDVDEEDPVEEVDEEDTASNTGSPPRSTTTANTAPAAIELNLFG